MATKKAAKNSKAPTKSEILNHISEETDLTRKEVSAVFDSLEGLIKKTLKGNEPGNFTMPGLMKIKVVKKPATKARKGINPFTGEETMFKAKPARNVVKIRAMKAIKELV